MNAAALIETLEHRPRPDGGGLRHGIGAAGVWPWQRADPVGGATLAGCTVSQCFELAPPGWRPGEAAA